MLNVRFVARLEKAVNRQWSIVIFKKLCAFRKFRKSYPATTKRAVSTRILNANLALVNHVDITLQSVFQASICLVPRVLVIKINTLGYLLVFQSRRKPKEAGERPEHLQPGPQFHLKPLLISKRG
jgi:hypothetical protein